MLVNEKASVRNAAAVGKLVQDKSAHTNILAMLEKLKPANIFQAEQIARQAAAETTVETQDSLFGEEHVTESLFLERARVMDAAIKRLRKDKARFNTLLQRGGEITEAGNVLDQDANAKRMREDATVQEYLTRQANSKGPISDALSEAARAVKGGASAGQVVSGFIGNVRSAIEGDSQAGKGIPADRREVEPRPADQAPNLGNLDTAVADPVAKASADVAQARSALDALTPKADLKSFMKATTAHNRARDAFADTLAERGGRIELTNKSGGGVTITPNSNGFQISHFLISAGFWGDSGISKNSTGPLLKPRAHAPNT